MRFGPTVLALALLVAIARAGAPAGRVAGKVRLDGPPVAPRGPIEATIDPEVCGREVLDESLLVDGSGGVRNAVVIVRGAASVPAAELPEVVIDNVRCRFVPRVQTVVRGQTVRVRSSDPVLHNAHPVVVGNPEVSVANLALPVVGSEMDLTRRLAAKLPERGEALVRFGCDVHPWMRGWLVVLEHPYAAVTAADGSFAIPNVPPGSYTLGVWHETLGRAERALTVPADGTATIDVTLARPH